MIQNSSKTSVDNRKFVGLVRVHRPDYLMVLFMMLLSLIGLIVLSSASAAHAVAINASSGADIGGDAFMQKQVFYFAAGLAGFIITALIPVGFWRKYREKLLWSALGLCLLLAVLGFAKIPLALCTAGACRWFNFGFITFQPAELLKFALVIFLAGFLAQRVATKQINNLQTTLIPVGILLAVSFLFVVIIQRDMGTGISLLGIVASMLFMANMKLKYFGIGVLVMALGTLLLIVAAPHRLDRVATLFTGSNSTTQGGSAYQITQAKIAMGSGGFLGKGLGNSTQVYGYLPEAVTDSMFAILGEMFGFAGLVTIMVMFLALFVRLLKTIDHLSDQYLRLLVAGVLGWLATQTIVNIGAMVGVLPLTGVTLPFISFGGTSLLFVMAALGIAFQVSRYTSHRANEEGPRNEDSDSGRGVRRSRHTRTRGYQRA